MQCHKRCHQHNHNHSHNPNPNPNPNHSRPQVPTLWTWWMVQCRKTSMSKYGPQSNMSLCSGCWAETEQVFNPGGQRLAEKVPARHDYLPRRKFFSTNFKGAVIWSVVGCSLHRHGMRHFIVLTLVGPVQWTTPRYYCRFHKKTVRLLGDAKVAEDAVQSGAHLQPLLHCWRRLCLTPDVVEFIWNLVQGGRASASQVRDQAEHWPQR